MGRAKSGNQRGEESRPRASSRSETQAARSQLIQSQTNLDLDMGSTADFLDESQRTESSSDSDSLEFSILIATPVILMCPKDPEALDRDLLPRGKKKS